MRKRGQLYCSTRTVEGEGEGCMLSGGSLAERDARSKEIQPGNLHTVRGIIYCFLFFKGAKGVSYKTNDRTFSVMAFLCRDAQFIKTQIQIVWVFAIITLLLLFVTAKNMCLNYSDISIVVLHRCLSLHVILNI